MMVVLWFVLALAVAAVATVVRVVAAGVRADVGRRLSATFGVNVVGSAVLGGLVGGFDGGVPLWVLGMYGTGALTTFSTFVAQLVELSEADRRRTATAYAVATLAVCISIAWVALATTSG